MKKETYVIGDIHGAYKALLQVLERMQYHPSKHKLIFLGDYVDGWSESAEVIEHLIKLKNENEDIIFLKGNHDFWAKDWLLFGHKNFMWVMQGGQDTIDSYIKTGYIASDEHRKFFTYLDNYYIDDENRGFVHGGFNSKNGLGNEIYEGSYYWDRDLWSLAFLSHKDFIKNKFQSEIKSAIRFLRHKEIYIGHTSTINWKAKPHYPEYNDKNQKKNNIITVPMNRCNVWNIDTGGGFKGKLTALNIETKEYVQSDYVNVLYANEKGRN